MAAHRPFCVRGNRTLGCVAWDGAAGEEDRVAEAQGRPQYLSERTKSRITAALKERGALGPCPSCGEQHWEMMNGFVFLTYQEATHNLRLDGPGLGLVGVGCGNCAYVAFYAPTILGIALPGQPTV